MALALARSRLVRSHPSPGRVAVATTSRWQGLIGCSAQDLLGQRRSLRPVQLRLSRLTAGFSVRPPLRSKAPTSLPASALHPMARLTSVVTVTAPGKPEISITAKLKCLR